MGTRGKTIYLIFIIILKYMLALKQYIFDGNEVSK